MFHSEKIKDIFKILVYTILIGASVPLINGICQEYLEGKTDFYSAKESIEIKDNPAVLVKFVTDDDIQFGHDYTVNLLHWNEELNEYLQDPNDIAIYHDRRQGNLSGQPHDITRANKTVMEITRMVTGFGDVFFLISPLTTQLTNGWTKIEWDFRKDVTKAPKREAKVAFTSAVNAWGATTDHFYDGRDLVWWSLHQGWNEVFSIADIKQIEHLQSECTQISYYECLEAALVNNNECSEHGGLCEYVTLPHSLLPVCNSDAHRECSGRVFWQVFGQNDHQCREQKTCSMIEYHESRQNRYNTSQFVYSFEYTIESPKSSEGERKQVPYKVVRQEYLIIDSLSFIANIGGLLGLTLGFSFIAAVEWLSIRLARATSRHS